MTAALLVGLLIVAVIALVAWEAKSFHDDP